MPQDLLSDILATLRADQERKKNKFEQGLKFQEERKVNEANIAHQKAVEAFQNNQLKQVDQQHKEQTRQFDLIHKATEAFNALKLHEEKNKLIDRVQGGGEAVGDTKSPVSISPQGGEYTPASGIGNTGFTEHSVPVGDETINFRTKDPKVFAREQGELEGIRNEPKYKQELDKIQQQKQFDILKSTYEQGQQNERTRLTTEAANARNNASIASRERVARINKANIPAAYQDYDITPHVQDALEGNISDKDVARLPIPQILKAHVLGALHDAGGKPFTDDQKALVGDYKGLVNIVDLMDQVIKNQTQTDSSLIAPIAGAIGSFNKDVTTPEDELKGHASIIARTIAKEKGALSNQDVQRMSDAFLTSRFRPLSTNIKKRNDYLKEVSTALDAKLSTVTPAQRQMIKEKLGLDKLKDLPLPGGGKKVRLLAPNGETRDFEEGDPAIEVQLKKGAKKVN